MSKQDKAALRYLNTQCITNYTQKMRIIGTLKHDVPNLRLDNCKFITAGLRMYYSGELNDEQSIRSLDTVLNYIHKGNHASEYDYDLNGLSLNELSSKYKDNIVTDGKNDRKRSEQIQRNGKNGYTIIPIETYEQAHKYSEYTSWCVTNGQNAFDSYTKYGNRFYFCLMNRFENTPKNDECAPLNDYGLSMISVEIDINGDLLRITTRYNHDFNGENNDGLCTVEQLEDILDENFYKVFLPYTREELHNRGIILFDEVQGLLENSIDPYMIFDYIQGESENYRVVTLYDKWNWISADNRLVSPNKWFNGCDKFKNGYAIVTINYKYNFVNTNFKYISNQWFDECYAFSNGYATVKLNGKWNWIDTNGNYISDQLFDWCDNFSNGYAIVKLDNKYNFINTNCNYLSEQWFYWCDSFNNGYAIVRLNNKYNFIDTNGNYISEQWFDWCDKFSNGYSIFRLNNKYNFIDTNGNYLSKQWFDWCDDFSNGYSVVILNHKYNLIYTNGKYLGEQWFNWCDKFSNGYAIVKLNNKWNCVDTNGNYISEQWFDIIEKSVKGYFKVEINEKIYFLTDKGELLENLFTIPMLVA